MEEYDNFLNNLEGHLKSNGIGDNEFKSLFIEFNQNKVISSNDPILDEIKNLQKRLNSFDTILNDLKSIGYADAEINLIEKKEKILRVEVEKKISELNLKWISSTFKKDFIVDNKFKIPENKAPNKLQKISFIIDLVKPPKTVKFGEKWYALYYLLKLKSTNSKLSINSDGSFIKEELEEIGRKLSGRKGQGFYREILKNHNDLNSKSLSYSFGKDWKDIIYVIAKMIKN